MVNHMDVILKCIAEYRGEFEKWVRDYWIIGLWFIPIINRIRLQNLDPERFKPTEFFHSKQLVVTKQVFFDYVLDLLVLIVVSLGVPDTPLLLFIPVAAFLLCQSCIRSLNEYTCEGECTQGRTSFQEIICITWDTRGITIYHSKGRFKNLFLSGRYSYVSYAGVFEFVDEAKRNGVPVFTDYKDDFIRKRVNPFIEHTEIEL